MTKEMVVNNNIQLRDIQSIIEDGEQIVLDGDTMCRVDDCFRFFICISNIRELLTMHGSHPFALIDMKNTEISQ